jgi:hypothetical protein
MHAPDLRVSVARAVAAVGVAVVALVACVAVSTAQAAPFAGERFAPVTDMSDSSALDVQAITVTPGDASTFTFRLTFGGPFAPPTDGYRVSVSVGDPTARRTRWTARVIDGQVVGVVETGDGTQWTPSGSTTAGLDPAGATATIVAQPGTVSPDSGLWVDAELPTPLGTLGAVSTYFSWEALTAPQTDPSIAGTAWGWTRDAAGARLDGAVRIPGAAPSAAILNRALVISSPDAPPTFLLGQPVTSATDFVKFADSTATTPGDGGFVMVNRVTGDVELFTVDGGVPTVVAGAGQRVMSTAPAAADAPGTRTISLDLAGVERELGLPDDPSNVAMSVDRALGLGNGSTVSASGVASTVASLEAVGTTPSAAGASGDVVESVKTSSADNVPVALIVAAAALALVVLGVVIVVLLAKRRKRRHESLRAEGWFDRDLAAQPLASRPPIPPTPIPPASAVAEPETSSVPEPPAGSAAEREPVLDLDADEPAAEPASRGANGHGNGTDAEDARATQDRALEELEAQLADLAQRVDRLGSGPDAS